MLILLCYIGIGFIAVFIAILAIAYYEEHY